MRWLQYLVVLGLGMTLAHFIVKHNKQKIEENFEVIWYSLSICDYCALFETDIAAPYKTHSLAKTAPMVMINMDDEGSGPYHLQQPIQQVPTAIIMKDGREVGRVTGMVDKHYFYAFVRDALWSDAPNTNHK